MSAEEDLMNWGEPVESFCECPGGVNCAGRLPTRKEKNRLCIPSVGPDYSSLVCAWPHFLRWSCTGSTRENINVFKKAAPSQDSNGVLR